MAALTETPLQKRVQLTILQKQTKAPKKIESSGFPSLLASLPSVKSPCRTLFCAANNTDLW